MAYQSESIKGINIRVFNWIQNMIKNRIVVDHDQLGSSSIKFGFLVLRVKNKIRIVRPRNCGSKKNHGGQIKKTTFKKNVQPFKICETLEEFVKGIELALGHSGLFFKETTPYLANTIYDYLSSSFECFGKNLNLLSSDMDGVFTKVVVVIDVDMQSGKFEIGSQRSNNVCSFQLTDLYETLVNDDDNEDRGDEFSLQVDGVQESCDGVNKKRRFDVDTQKLVNDGGNEDREGELYLQVDSGVAKKRRVDVQKMLVLEVEYTFNDSDVQEIVDTLLDFLTKRKGFNNKVEIFDGKIQEFREVISGLKIVKLTKKNAVNFELGDICHVCFEILEEKSLVVITPCSHIFHRSCIFTWLSENNTCPICRESCDV